MTNVVIGANPCFLASQQALADPFDFLLFKLSL